MQVYNMNDYRGKYPIRSRLDVAREVREARGRQIRSARDTAERRRNNQQVIRSYRLGEAR